jgi:hypothetical protein
MNESAKIELFAYGLNYQIELIELIELKIWI